MTPEKSNLLSHIVILGFIALLIWQFNRAHIRDNANKADCQTKYRYIKRRISLTKRIKDLSDIEDDIHSFYADFKFKVNSEMLNDLNGRLWASIHNKGAELMGKILVSN